MKRLLIITGLFLAAPLVQAQQYVVLKTDNFTAAGNGATVRTIGTAMTFVRLSWNIQGGTLSACTVKIQTAAAQGGPFSDLAGSTATCTSNGAGTFIGTTPNFIRVVLVTKTGSATTLTTTLVGWQVLPAAVIVAPGAPVGACSDGTLYQNSSNGDLYLCESGSWVLISFGGGGAITGGGAAGRCAFWTGATTLSSDTGILCDPATDKVTAGAFTWSVATQGSILFADVGGALSQDNANLFWDNAAKTLTVRSTGIGLNLASEATDAPAYGGLFFNRITSNLVTSTTYGAGISTTAVINGSAHFTGTDINSPAVSLLAGGVTIGNTAVVDEAYGILVDTFYKDPGATIGSSYALRILDQTATATNKYAIKTGTGKVQLGAASGEVIFDGATASKCAKFDSNKAIVSDAGTCLTAGALTQAGLGAPIQVGVVRAVSQVAAIGTTTIFTVGASDAMFDANFALNCDTTSAAATFNITLGWTDPASQAQTATLGSAIVCTALGSSSIGNLRISFAAKTATNITYATSIVNTPTYDIRGALYQVTSN